MNTVIVCLLRGFGAQTDGGAVNIKGTDPLVQMPQWCFAISVLLTEIMKVNTHTQHIILQTEQVFAFCKRAAHECCLRQRYVEGQVVSPKNSVAGDHK